jgi:flagellar hook protein FlgE
MPNNGLVYTTVTNPTTGAAIFPTPAPTAGQWSPTGQLTFNTSGIDPVFNAYSNATLIPSDPPSTVSPPSPAAATSIQFAPNGTSGNVETIPFDFSASTQFGVPFGVTKLSQDGYTAGQLSGFTIGSDGTITGNYSNGVTKALGQIALTTFANMQGLQPLGNNTWAQTQASGSAVTNAPGSGLNGTLQTGATEDSSTNLTDELVNMMTAQRNYQANAQTIKTQDTVMQTLINLR